MYIRFFSSVLDFEKIVKCVMQITNQLEVPEIDQDVQFEFKKTKKLNNKIKCPIDISTSQNDSAPCRVNMASYEVQRRYTQTVAERLPQRISGKNFPVMQIHKDFKKNSIT